MILNKSISVIIPCKNEEAALYFMLQKIPKYVDEVIVVDNNSTDNTAYVAKLMGAKVISEKRTENGNGYGFAHQTGMKHAKGDIIIALDGDDTYPIEKIGEIAKYLEKSGAGFVSCSRFPLNNAKAISKLRQLGVKILNMQVHLLYGYQVNDILSGMWAINRTVIKKLNVDCGEWNFSPGIKLAAISNPDIQFSEYHIPHEVRFNGTSKQNIWMTGANHLFYILKRRFTDDNLNIKNVILNNTVGITRVKNILPRTISARIGI
jgi:glycosyltransferase involved in cell wall biosynthesis